MKDDENATDIIFSVKNNEEYEEMIRLSPKGFYYKGERIDDVHNVYNRLEKWLHLAEVKSQEHTRKQAFKEYIEIIKKSFEENWVVQDTLDVLEKLKEER